MTRLEQTVFVVDDDPSLRQSLQWLLESVGLRVETYASADEFLDIYQPPRQGCLLLDIRMPGMTGLDLQQALLERRIALPTIIITGHGDVPTAVRAMKAGAVDFIEKPFNDQLLLDRIHQALERNTRQQQREVQRLAALARLVQLTRREREVMNLVVAGKTNKTIATELGLSEKTVEVHRANLMKKLQLNSVAELVKLAVAANVN